MITGADTNLNSCKGRGRRRKEEMREGPEEGGGGEKRLENEQGRK